VGGVDLGINLDIDLDDLDTSVGRRLSTFVNGSGGMAVNPFDPVVVRPSQEEISRATVVQLIDEEDEVCAICQDQMPVSTEARCITACDHKFHVECIDTWFQRNVHCPNCRHDIRESHATNAVAAETNTGATGPAEVG
jgi:hypothetical protein